MCIRDSTVARFYTAFVTSLSLLLVCATGPAHAQQSHDTVRLTPVVRAVQRSAPSVVNISGRKPANQPQQLHDRGDSEVNGMGTGLIIDSRGYILTNHHVIAGIDRIQVRLSRTADVDIKDYAAQIIAVDSQTCLLYTSPSPRDATLSRMPSSA